MNIRAWVLSLVASTPLVLNAGCQRADNSATEKAPPQARNAPAVDQAAGSQPDAKEKTGEGVKLTQEERQKIGITTRAVKEVQYRSEQVAFGVVQERQPIVQGVAEALSAETNAQYSRQSLERAQRLKGTPGAVSADLEQSAAQKETVDSTALGAVRNKLSTLWGPSAPWKENVRDPRVALLVRGESFLVRVTVPLGTLAAVPAEVYAGRFGAQRTEATLTLKPVWPAPSDVNMPGPSLFAMAPGQTTVEGEHLQVWVPNGPAITGVLIPSEGVVLNGGRFWCYVERSPGTFERVAVRTDRPFSGGYVVTDGAEVGDPVVISGVAHLLAKESGAADEPD